jgi:hypothetical protein
MRSLVSALLGYVLATMLVGSSPIGTGQGVHQNQLLDALVPHVHFVDGQQVQPGASNSDATVYRSGPAFGAGAGATAGTSGLALTAPLPANLVGLSEAADRWQFPAADVMVPRGRTEAPPDPPPTFWS